MALRTSVSDVGLIFNTSLGSAIVTAFITTANLIVNEELVGSGMTDARLVEVEKWLSAHLLATRDQRYQSKAVDSNRTTVSYQGKTGLGLKATFYGQQVLLLDRSGTLASLGEGLKSASIKKYL